MATQLTIFYDGQCPLCVREMKQLKRLDKEQQIAFEDILEDDFSERYPQVSVAKANTILHGMNAQGKMLYGLDVTHAAWSLAGRGWLTAPLRWPLIRWVADKIYLYFARNRYRISKLVTGQARCERCSLD
ncbi:thiol-disulfide oxidoreductase DCC family protein [Aliidiomarina indica]|uniref:thiol-disulfide oxidoreductase DCC family protein n=1 Tax=Aliidiomarina indica TaxID=2749147 RepID=UPI00188F71B9|nr:DUF393 domain-containing protein [Aliidiomarina indica]